MSHQTLLWGQQDLRHCRTSARLHPQFHPSTWPSLGCQLRCCLSWWARTHCSTWHQDHLLRAFALPGISRWARVSGRSSCTDSPMSLGSPAPTSSLALALKVRATCAPMPALLDAKTDFLDDSSNEKDMDAMNNSPRDTTD